MHDHEGRKESQRRRDPPLMPRSRAAPDHRDDELKSTHRHEDPPRPAIARIGTSQVERALVLPFRQTARASVPARQFVARSAGRTIPPATPLGADLRADSRV